MIKINLLPQELAGRSASATTSASSGSAIVALVLFLAFALNIGIGGYVFYNRQQVKNQLDLVKAEDKKVADELKNTKVQFDEVKGSLENMRRLIAVAEKLDPPDRVLWSRKLNGLPLLAPAGVFLTELAVTQKIAEVETEEYMRKVAEWNKTRKGPQPVRETSQIITQTMTMNGVSYVEQGTDTQRLDQVNTFYRNMLSKKVKLPFDQEETSFMDGFVAAIEPSPLRSGKVEGRDVLQFTFTINTKPMNIN